MNSNEKGQNSIPRRKFIKSALVSSVGLIILPRHVLGGKGYLAPSDKVNIGLIGAGGRSKGIVSDLFALDDVQLTAVADPSEY